jgi:energy-coupling factor transport system permease protein
MKNFKLETVSRDSIFTQLDFRTKLVMILVITLIAFIWESPISGGVLTASVMIACLIAGVRMNYLGTILKITIPFYVFLWLSMGFFNVDQVKLLTHKTELTPLFIVPAQSLILAGAKMSVEGSLYAMNIIFKTLTMVLIIPLGIFTTDINQMVISLVLAKIPYKVVFIFSSTLRLFPLLLEELQSIIDAQRLRGLAVEKMNLFQKARVYATIAVPLILNSMVKSQKLEIILQAKAFSGNSNRTFLSESILNKTDYIVMGSFIGLFVLTLILYFSFGVGKFAWLIYN